MSERESVRRKRTSSFAARAALAGFVTLLLWAPVQVMAQEPDPTTTTTTSTTSTTSTAPPIVPPPAEEPPPPPPGEQPPPAEEPPPPPPGEEPPDDSGPSEVPQDVVVVPPPEGPVEPDPIAPILRQVANITLAEVNKGVKIAEQTRAIAAGQAGGLSLEVQELEARLTRLEGEKAQAVARLQQARLQLKKRAVAGYMGSPAAPINRVLDSGDFNDLSRRFELLQSVIESDKARITEYNDARDAVGSELDELVVTLDTKRSALTVALSSLEGSESSLLAKQVQLAAVRAGGAVVGGGFVFPVGGPHSYSDTFGAPRMFGTAYAHLHQGTDIFAASGTPLLAVERGVLIKVGTDTLGGTKLWLVGASGTRYYYAHLSAFAEGVVEGMVVSAGDVVGFVGNTGNALTTPAHLHFEVHPGGGPAVNPYPLLRIVDDAQKRAGASRPFPTTTTTTPRT